MNIKFKINTLQIFILLLGTLAWKIFIFSHPYPKEILNSTFWFLFFISFLAYLYSLRFGRILLVFLGLSATRFTSMAFNNEIELVTNAPVFLGGIFGLFLRAIFLNPSSFNKSTSQEGVYKFPILFLCILILDRFLIYYNFPFIYQAGMQELLFTPRFTSKMALSFSSEIFVGLTLPCLYFISEEVLGKGKYKKDLFLGLLFTFFINGIVIGIQTYVNINFFSFQTNLAFSYGRATGLFRDAGSASFIFPSIIAFVFFHLFRWKFSKKTLILVFFLALSISLGKSMGRAFWILLLGCIPYLLFYINLNFHKGFILGLLFIIFAFFSLQTFLARNPEFLINILKADWESLDPARSFLNKIAWYSFLQSPFFGNGMGSFPTALDDPTHPVSNPTKIIDSPMFFFGLLNDLGILGVFFLLLYLIYTSFYYKNSLGIWILLLSMIVGYHVYHPDNSFWILLMIAPLNSRRFHVPLKWIKRIEIIFMIIIVLYLFNITYKFLYAEKVPVFRYAITQKYQLQAYSINHKAQIEDFEFEYNNFLGSVIWRIKHISRSFQIHFLLSNYTKKESLNLNLIFLDKNYHPLENKVISIYKWEKKLTNLILPENTEFLQVEELDESGKVIKLGRHIYSVNQKNFDEKNQLISLQESFTK